MKNIKALLDILNATTLTNMDVFKDLKHRMMTKELNLMKKEHDLLYIKPDCRTIGQVEVKSMSSKQNNEVLKALEQLKGGKEEIARAHGHTLDNQWTFIGVVCLPELPPHLK